MDRNDNLLTQIPVSKQMWLLAAFFVPILIWKRVETGITQGQIVFIYCLLILGFFQALKSSQRARDWVIGRHVPRENVVRTLIIPIWVWRIMSLAGFGYLLWEKTQNG